MKIEIENLSELQNSLLSAVAALAKDSGGKSAVRLFSEITPLLELLRKCIDAKEETETGVFYNKESNL